MTLARTYSAALVGAEGRLVEVEVDVADGQPTMTLFGLPGTAQREALDRIRAAIINSGETWPTRKIAVTLSPVSLCRRGSDFDLAIAVSILAAAGSVPATTLAGVMFLAELGLDGRLRPVRRVLPAIAAAAGAGTGTVVIAAGNATEAAAVPNIRVIPAQTLTEVIVWLRGGPPSAPSAGHQGEAGASRSRPPLDLA